MIRDLGISESAEPLSDETLDGLEKRRGLRLPQPYRQFLLLNNGGRPDKCVFQYQTQDGRCGSSFVDTFFSVYEGEYHNWDSYFDTYKSWRKRVPDNLIPIADDPGGNLVLLSVSGEDVGNVYFWDHHKESRTGEPTWDNVYPIAKTFPDFLDSLRERG